MTGWEERYVRVITDGGFIDFFDRFLQATAVTSLVVVTPWISDSGKMGQLLDAVTQKVRKEHIRTTVILREPIKEPINASSVRRLSKVTDLTLWYNDELHAKVYACKCDPYGFAYVGSANLTGRGSVAFEVGLLVEGKGAGKKIVDELARLGDDLINRAGTHRKEPDD